MAIMTKCLHLSVKYYTFRVCHYFVVVIINIGRYYVRINNLRHIERSLKLPYFIQTMLEKFQVYHYVVLSLEIAPTTSDG